MGAWRPSLRTHPEQGRRPAGRRRCESTSLAHSPQIRSAGNLK